MRYLLYKELGRSFGLTCSKAIVRAIKISGAALFVIILFTMASCDYYPSQPDTFISINNQEKDDEIFNEIHKRLHENPLQTRERALLLLDSIDPGNIPFRIKILKQIGSSYVLEANYSEAIKYYNNALTKADEINLYSEMARINNNIGVVYNYIGNLKSAFIHFNEALNFYNIAGMPEDKFGTINNIGLIYLHLGNLEKAYSYFDEALNSEVQPTDTVFIVSVLNNMAICMKEDSERALRYTDRAITLSKKINNEYGLCISYKIMGDTYFSLSKADSALYAYSRSMEIAKSRNLSFQLAISKLGIAKTYLISGRTDEAFEIANSVMDMAREHDNLVFENEAHIVLSDISEVNGDFEKSLMHYREHNRTQQELSNQTIMHQIYDLELSNLSQVNKMQQLEIEKKELAISKQSNLFLFTSLIFILVSLGFYLLYLNYRHGQKVKFQKTIIDLTEKKSHAALEAEIQERKRIGQELHDSLGHLLSLAGLHAGVLHKRKDCSEEKKNELLESLMKSIDDAFTEVRNISHNLAPSLLSERGLKGALKSISDKVNQSTNLKMSYKTFGLNGKLDNLVENTLFRTIQEVVNNTIKHSNANKLFIQIAQGTDEITLMAEDNGKGFDFETIKQSSGNGLTHMKSRIENLKGNVFIDSNPNRGTIVSIYIPLQFSN